MLAKYLKVGNNLPINRDCLEYNKTIQIKNNKDLYV